MKLFSIFPVNTWHLPPGTFGQIGSPDFLETLAWIQRETIFLGDLWAGQRPILVNNHPGQALDHLDVIFPLAQEPGLIVMLKLTLNPPKAIYDYVTIGVYSR